MGVDITFTDNAPKVLSEFERKVKLALAVIGETAEGYAKEGTPVDTGRLRNSITYATSEYGGKKTYKDDQGGQYFDGAAQAIPHENEVYIGTNVEYAAAQEYGEHLQHTTGGAHFLKNAATTHSEEYEDKTKKIMES